MQFQIGIVPFWKNYDRKLVLRAAQLADDLGYHSIWIPEAWAYEQFQLLAEIALHTQRLKVATGIVNIFSRSAALIAMSAATLDEISSGRVILGLGTSGKLVVENLHGVEYRKPLTRMKETIQILRTLWRGERLSPGVSTLFPVRHFKLEMKPVRPNIPIYIAALQEKAIRQIGAIADGWVPTFWPYRHFRTGLDWIAAGAREAGRDPQAIELAPFVGIVPLEDRSAARAMLKPTVAFYIGGMGTYYYEMFCRFGFEENATKVRDLYVQGRRSEATAAVDDALIDAIAICGPPEYCREQMAAWRAEGVGTFLMNLPTGVPYEVTENLLRAMAG
ncbi:MAG: LLM class F420-dependent oxidoreductase [Candidatus Binatia bacterium]|nr:MAG: LLM class F420-dependent oxidoreductase [Candidatus Binatia bacterium]